MNLIVAFSIETKLPYILYFRYFPCIILAYPIMQKKKERHLSFIDNFTYLFFFKSYSVNKEQKYNYNIIHYFSTQNGLSFSMIL